MKELPRLRSNHHVSEDKLGQEQQMELECDSFVYYTSKLGIFIYFSQKQRIVCNESELRIAHLANRLEDRGWNQSH
jgi:hypothetical protein